MTNVLTPPDTRSAQAASLPPPAPEDDIDLRQYLHMLWRRRTLIVALTVAAAIGGFILSWFRPPTYEATVTLARTSALRIGDDQNSRTSISFRALLQNRRLAEQLIKQFSLDGSPYRLTPTSFVNDAVRVEDVDQGAMIVTRVTLPHSRDLVARVANGLARGAVDLNRQMNQAESAAARDFIKKQLDEAQKTLDVVEARLVGAQQQAQIAAVEADLDAILASRRQLLMMSVEIEGEKAKLETAQRELSGRERVLPAPRAVDTSAALLEATRQAQSAASPPPGGTGPPDSSPPAVSRPGGVPTPSERTRPVTELERPRPGDEKASREQNALNALSLRSEFVNPVYEALDYQVATSRTRLASLREQERQLRAVVQAGRERNPTLSNFYARQVEIVRLQAEHELAKQNYTYLSTKYEQARIEVASRTSQLEIIDPAMPPQRAIAPRPLRAAALSGILGGLVATPVALLLGYMSSPAGGPLAGASHDRVRS